MLKNIPKDFKIKLIGVNETIFERKDQTLIHEATFIYNIYLDLKTELLLDKVVYEQDEEINKKLDFKWIKLEKLKKIDFRPNAYSNKSQFVILVLNIMFLDLILKLI